LLRHFEDEITFTTYRTMYSRKRASIWKISFLCRAKFARWYIACAQIVWIGLWGLRVWSLYGNVCFCETSWWQQSRSSTI
jgi:hypothetical protein